MKAFMLLPAAAIMIVATTVLGHSANGAVIVGLDGAPVVVPAEGASTESVIPGGAKAARLSERTDRKVVRFTSVVTNGVSMQVERFENVGYERYRLTMKNGSKSAMKVDDVGFFRDWAPTAARDGKIVGDGDGAVAVFPSALTYVGVEHPLARLSMKDGRLTARLERGYRIAAGESWSFYWVVGRFAPGQLRRDFGAYLNAERAHPYRVFPHYNSWYDLNIDRNSDPWQSRMNESLCLDRLRRFRKELGDRGVFINSYVWDDGWSDFDTLWDFHPGFPNGFRRIADEAHVIAGASIGCWMSPCGGYGDAQTRRVGYAKTLGIVDKDETLLRMSSPKYYGAFRDRVLKMIRDYDMNMFKFDRMGGGHDDAGGRGDWAPDMEAIVRLVGEMRREKQDVFVNATVGTWPSPFWLMHADSIWRGGLDFAYEGEGRIRQQWLTYRDNRVHDKFAMLNPLFPLNSVMLHGVIVTKYGPPKCEDLSDTPESTQDFADEVWMSVGCGTCLQEYYVSPDEMHSEWWDVLAAGIRWLKENEATLVDVHWIGGDPHNAEGKGEVYGYAAWRADGEKAHGVVLLRNPSSVSKTFHSSFSALMEIPKERRGDGIVSVVKAYGHDAECKASEKADDGLDFKLDSFGMLVLNVEMKVTGK